MPLVSVAVALFNAFAITAGHWKIISHITFSLVWKVKVIYYDFFVHFMPSIELHYLNLFMDFFSHGSIFWPTLNTQFQSLPGTHETLKESERRIVLPDMVTDTELWYAVSWKHLLPLCNEHAELSAHEPNGKTLMETVRSDKNNDPTSGAEVGWLHLKVPHHFNWLTHLIFH